MTSCLTAGLATGPSVEPAQADPVSDGAIPGKTLGVSSPVAADSITATASWSTTLPFSFRVSGVTVRDLDPSSYPWLHVDEPVPVLDEEPHDADGVRLAEFDGALYDHVSVQARYGLRNLASYILTGDVFFLSRAEVQAQRLVDRRMVVGEAWFHPYDFTFYGMTPPWCSALGNGHSLKLFGDLYRVTGEPAYLEAAQGTFASYLQLGPASFPWIVSVDSSGYLWMEQYPSSPSDPVLNGHIAAALGLYDYYQLTHDGQALELLDGALTTVLRYAQWFRAPGWTSYYSFSHRTASPSYHQVHVKQFLTLYKLTGMTAFARFADDLTHDYPRPEVSGNVRMMPGVYTGLRFNSAGRAMGRRTWRLTQVAHLTVNRRKRIHDQPGYWFATRLGPWTGYYLREEAGAVYMPGVLPLLSYDPPRTLELPAGHAYVARTYDATGAVTASLTFAPDTPARATVDQRAIVNGIEKVRVASGPLQGHWLRLGPAVLR